MKEGKADPKQKMLQVPSDIFHLQSIFSYWI